MLQMLIKMEQMKLLQPTEDQTMLMYINMIKSIKDFLEFILTYQILGVKDLIIG